MSSMLASTTTWVASLAESETRPPAFSPRNDAQRGWVYRANSRVPAPPTDPNRRDRRAHATNSVATVAMIAGAGGRHQLGLSMPAVVRGNAREALNRRGRRQRGSVPWAALDEAAPERQRRKRKNDVCHREKNDGRPPEPTMCRRYRVDGTDLVESARRRPEPGAPAASGFPRAS